MPLHISPKMTLLYWWNSWLKCTSVRGKAFFFCITDGVQGGNTAECSKNGYMPAWRWPWWRCGEQVCREGQKMYHCTYHPPFCWQPPLFQIILPQLIESRFYSSESAFPPSRLFFEITKNTLFHLLLLSIAEWRNNIFFNFMVTDYTLQGNKGLRWNMTGVMEDYFHQEKHFFWTYTILLRGFQVESIGKQQMSLTGTSIKSNRTSSCLITVF